MKYENLVKGLRHVTIKVGLLIFLLSVPSVTIRQVWPPECFEEGAEFLASLSKVYDNAHGNRLKTIFAETLVQILHPIGKVGCTAAISQRDH